MSDRISFAASRPDLPGEGITADTAARAAFAAARAARPAHEETLGRGSDMVRKDRPHPAPRPSPALAYGADAAAFNTGWERERRAAERAARKAAYERDRQMPRTDFRSKAHQR